jgi:uncharacterized ParB-like nuclease family protein
MEEWFFWAVKVKITIQTEGQGIYFCRVGCHKTKNAANPRDGSISI